MFNPELLRAVSDEWPGPDDSRWFRTANPHVKKLAQVFDLDKLGPQTQKAVRKLQSAQFLRFLSAVTGVDNLIPDPHFAGGLLNDIDEGGYISGHLDFNFNGALKLYRRINVLVYLNDDWRQCDEGRLQFWDKVRRIAKTGSTNNMSHRIHHET
jgi:Rps23 Pro-64 3,4-dihydroxylase Tpa1-like proline 4-hydroxylase